MNSLAMQLGQVNRKSIEIASTQHVTPGAISAESSPRQNQVNNNNETISNFSRN